MSAIFDFYDENFYIFYFQKRIFSTKTFRGNTVSVLIFLNYRICQPVTPTRPTRPPRTTTTPTTTVGPTTTTEVRSGMNLCDPDPFGPMKKNGYEINLVICEANEVCQPLASNGELAKVGYIVFLFLN